LIDLVLPGESGLSIADYAKSLGVSVILMTGSPEKIDGLAHRKIAKPRWQAMGHVAIPHRSKRERISQN
jgi:hypothetical protein